MHSSGSGLDAEGSIDVGAQLARTFQERYAREPNGHSEIATRILVSYLKVKHIFCLRKSPVDFFTLFF